MTEKDLSEISGYLKENLTINLDGPDWQGCITVSLLLMGEEITRSCIWIEKNSCSCGPIN